VLASQSVNSTPTTLWIPSATTSQTAQLSQGTSVTPASVDSPVVKLMWDQVTYIYYCYLHVL
jgi:hypothetical protein